ncbi:MAG: hypothetical protein K2Y14_09125 [Burkholderiales bacterium]|nr:hypothetical protein [Burkholderiales bacterium]
MHIINKHNVKIDLNLFCNTCGDYNAVLASKSGIGKTTLVEYLIRNQLEPVGKAFIIEEGCCYKNLCDELSGNHVEFNLLAPVCINPFAFINWTHNEEYMSLMEFEDLFSHEIFAITEILVLMIGRKKLDQHDIQMLEMAVIKSAKQQRKATITTVVEYLLSSDNISQASKMVEWLQPFTSTGEYSAFFEGDDTQIIKNQLNVFELEGLGNSPQLRDIVLCTLIFIVNEVMGFEPRKYNICIIEELYSLFGASNISSQFIQDSFRLARLTNGSFISVTQSIDDYSRNEAMDSMYTNSTWKLLLRHENLIELSERLDVDKLQMLQSLNVQRNFSDLMVIHGNVDTDRLTLVFNSDSKRA